MKKYKAEIAAAVLITFFGVLGLATTALAAPNYRIERTILPETTAIYELGTTTKTWYRGYFDGICFAADCRTSWPGGLTGSTGQVAYFSGTDTPVGTSTIFIATNSKVGIGTTTPAQTFSVAGSGLISGTLTFADTGGTTGGSIRWTQSTSKLEIFGGSTGFEINNSVGNVKIYRNGTSASNLLNVTSTGLTGASGTQTALLVDPTITQSGTASYNALLVNVTESSTGSGTRRLISAQLAGSDRFSVNSLGLATMTSASTTNFSASTALYGSFPSAVWLADANNLATAASAQTCTNQFFRALSAAYSVTCATVQSEDINLADTFVWSGAHDFGGASDLEIPNGSNPTVDAIGEIALDTTSNRLLVASSTNASYPIVYGAEREATLADLSTSTLAYKGAFAAAGTTTLNLGAPSYGELITKIACYTDAGTTTIRYGDGTNWMSYIQCGSGTDTIEKTVGSNNSFTSREKRKLEVGTLVGSMNNVTITVTSLISRD
jgi:hypothetical protein